MKQTILKRFFYILSAMILFVSCKKDNVSVSPDYELTDKTKIVDSTMWGSITALDTNQIIFQSSSLFLQQLQPGDILLSNPFKLAPGGFLRKITAIHFDNGSYTINTTEPDLTEAFKTLHVDIHQTLNLTDTTQGGNKTQGFEIDVAKVLFDKDGDLSTTNDQISVNGSLSLEVSVDFQLDISLSSYPHFYAGATVNSNLDENLKIGASVGSFSKEITIYKVSLPPLRYGIFSVTPTIQINLGADGEIYAQVIFDGTQTYTSNPYVDYSKGEWTGNATKSLSATTIDSSFELNGNGEIYLDVAIEMAPYDLKSTKADINLKSSLNAVGQESSNPSCSLDAELQGSADAQLGLADLTLLSGSLTLFDVSKNLYTCNGDGDTPGQQGGGVDCSNFHFDHFVADPPGANGYSNLGVFVMGGYPPYQYQFDHKGWQSSSTFEFIPGSSFEVEVKDARGCDISFIYH